jgi:hypothetical protein
MQWDGVRWELEQLLGTSQGWERKVKCPHLVFKWREDKRMGQTNPGKQEGKESSS